MEEIAEYKKKECARLEAFLFHYGEPIAMKKAAALLKQDESVCAENLEILKKMFELEERGIMLASLDGKVQLVTKPEYADVAEKIVEDEFSAQLSPAALETLSVIAYLGPVSRSTVDYIRGVNSSFIIRSLLMRGLIERKQNEKRKNVYDYHVSFDFLSHMGLGSISELPEYEKYKDILKKFELREFEEVENESGEEPKKKENEA